MQFFDRIGWHWRDRWGQQGKVSFSGSLVRTRNLKYPAKRLCQPGGLEVCILRKDGEISSTRIIHGLVFWFSCNSLKTFCPGSDYQKDREKSCNHNMMDHCLVWPVANILTEFASLQTSLTSLMGGLAKQCHLIAWSNVTVYSKESVTFHSTIFC